MGPGQTGLEHMRPDELGPDELGPDELGPDEVKLGRPGSMQQ